MQRTGHICDDAGGFDLGAVLVMLATMTMS